MFYIFKKKLSKRKINKNKIGDFHSEPKFAVNTILWFYRQKNNFFHMNLKPRHISYYFLFIDAITTN